MPGLGDGPPEEKLARLRRGVAAAQTAIPAGGLLRQINLLLDRIGEDLEEIENDIRQNKQE